jgi:hypothetical protein
MREQTFAWGKKVRGREGTVGGDSQIYFYFFFGGRGGEGRDLGMNNRFHSQMEAGTKVN